MNKVITNYSCMYASYKQIEEFINKELKKPIKMIKKGVKK